MLTTQPETITNQTATTPKIAIVIPVFKHSVLVAEAIACALEQDTQFPYVVIIVNDGCKFAETDRVGRDFALAYPDRVIYLYRPNGGLSAARNTGIDFAITTWDSIEAIYLLDADNRISPNTIERSFQVLLSEPEVGWVYPTINMFGQEYNGDYRGEYSVLSHLRFNTCEAGSLIARAVFEAGCRYDEAMKLGFEDWEFWWQAIDAGYRGKHLPEFGFQYRKRLESMLKNSERDKDGIIHYMQRKHRSLFTHRTILNLEHKEAPRYAIFLSDTGEVFLTSDPTCLERSITLKQFREIYYRCKFAPVRYHRPYFMAFTRSEVLTFLQQQGLLRWVFWRLESVQEAVNFAGLNVNLVSDSSGIITHENESEFQIKAGDTDHLIMTTAQTMDACLSDPQDDWIQSLLSPQPMPQVFDLQLSIPNPQTEETLGSGALYKLLSVFKDLRRSLPTQKEQLSWNWHTNPFPPRDWMFDHARWALNNNAVYPILTQSKERHIGFILPIVEFGGVEKVALNIAKVFQDAGWKVHLFIFNSRMQQLPKWARIFETINFYHEKTMDCWDGPRYAGSRYDTWSDSGEHKTALGLMSWLNVVVNFHSSAAHGIVGSLRRAGVKTVSSLHVHDLSSLNRIKGHGYLTLGYEHAYDLLIPCSYKMLDWCHGMGVPEDKLVVVPNACGYPLEESKIEQILARRQKRGFTGKLRVLFIGRFDRQKGLDRLVGTVTKSRQLGLPIHWRLVGKNIVKGENAADELKPLEDLIEPPVFTTEGLNQLYQWADVLLLPSYWEGLPLTILEAMRLGVVVCASDVGAVAEAVEHEQTGLVIPNLAGDAFVDAVVESLSKLIDNPSKLEEISNAAAVVASKRSWDRACDRLIDKLTK